MITIAHSFTRVVVTAAFLGMALATTATAAAAQGETPKAIWLAAGSGSQESKGTDWGQLTLRDGVLTFRSPTTEWQLAVSDIKRASIEKSDRLVVESVAGDVYYVTILDARMSAGSPRLALKLIQSALRTTTSRHE